MKDQDFMDIVVCILWVLAFILFWTLIEYILGIPINQWKEW